MKNIHLSLVFLLCSISAFVSVVSASPNENKIQKQTSSISVERAYIRSSIPGTTVTSSYMVIENKGEKTVTLIGANSKISPRIEIHQHSMSEGMMRMRQLDSIDINAKQRVVLQPSGLHLMLFDVNNPLKDQQEVELTLNFSNEPSLTIQVPVYSPAQINKAQNSDAHTAEQHKHHH